MQSILFENNASSTLAAAITSSAVSVTLAPGTGALFPSPGTAQYFVGTLTDAATGLLTEIVHVTNVTTDTLTIVRAQEGTIARAWNIGDIFSNLITAGALMDIQQGVQIISAVTATTGGTLSAAELLGGIINRSGPTANYADATDTAANIVAALQFPVVGLSFRVRILNTVAFTNDITGGSGVTLAGTTNMAASSWRDYLAVVTNVGTPAITLTGIGAGTL